MKKQSFLLVMVCVSCFKMTIAQSPLLEKGKIQFRLNEEGSHFIRLTFLNQVWVRYTETNPGSTIFGKSVNNVADIGLRRTRVQLYGQLTNRIFFYTQFGQNNFSYLSPKFSGFFFHDAVVEYQIKERFVTLGSGLTGWSGLSRYASPSVGTILSLDAPLYQQATNSINDQFLRKLSIYAKGKIGKLDYRLALTKPMAVQNATVPISPISQRAEFSLNPPKMQIQGYFKYEFLDEEANTTPYNVGSYLGTKRVFNMGVGIIHQPDALWYTNSNADTIMYPLNLIGIDLFYDSPLNKERGDAITVYASYHWFDFGPNYIRNTGVMNPANGIDTNGIYNGAGNAFPMTGTGGVLFGQVGYLLKKNLFSNKGTLQPYFSIQYANYRALSNAMVMVEGGINWYIQGTHDSKITLNYQNRPVYTQQLDGSIVADQRKGMYQIQYQIAI